MANEGICLDALEIFAVNKNSSLARIVNCADTPRQLWSYDFSTQQIIQRAASNNCLTASADAESAFEASSSVQSEPSKWSIGERRRNDISINNNNNNNVNGNALHSGTKESKFNVNTAPCMVASKLQKWMLLPFAWK